MEFFKELELYQELKFQNRKSNEESGTWGIEKQILEWTVWNHHHLGSPRTLKDTLTDIQKNHTEITEKNVEPAFKNLIQRGYAYTTDNNAESLIFTKEGLLMGRVIMYSAKRRYLNRYELFYWFTWIVMLAASLTIIINFLNTIGLVVASIFAVSFILLFVGYRS